MRFYGQFDPPVDKVLYDTYFTDVRGGVCIEAGAYDGELESCCKVFEEFLGWTGVNVEASPHNFKLLQARRPNAINVNAALSDVNGTATFNHAVHPVHGADFGNGSLGHTAEHMEDLLGQGCTFETYEVETMRYDTLLDRHGIEVVDLFVLDVEGHELSVLRGMEGTQRWPRVFCIEHGHIGADNLRGILEPVGYVFDGIADANAYFSLPGVNPWN
jgi:FkbM family methyltransferase